jgi:hypothetical protein
LLSVICFAGFGVWYLVVNQSDEPKTHTTEVPPPDAKAATQVSVEAVKIPAAYYSKTDVDKLLDATREISELLQNAIPVRESALAFDRTWNQIILDQGSGVARVKLKEIKIATKSITDQGWAISNKYSHYNKELAPILSGMSYSEKFSTNIESFNRAIEKLRPDVDPGTLSLLEPVRTEYQAGLTAFQAWISGTWERNEAATGRFRTLAIRADDPPAKPTLVSATTPPKITTAAIDVPKKLAAIDALRKILNEEMLPWINSGQQLSTGGWWNWYVGDAIPEMQVSARNLYVKSQELDREIHQLQNDNIQFPDIHALASSPLGTPFLLRIEKLVTPILALPKDDPSKKMGNDLYRFLFEPYAKETYAALNDVQNWRGTTDRNAIELRRQLSQ